MSSVSEEDPIKRAERTCSIAQSMIDYTAKHLRGLRTQCATTEEITQQEIRGAETKLITYFTNQLIHIQRARAANNGVLPGTLTKYPNTASWLEIVGLKEEVTKGILTESATVEKLLEMSPDQVTDMLQRYKGGFDETSRLNKALCKLKICLDRQTHGEKPGGSDDFHWEPSGSSTPTTEQEKEREEEQPEIHPKPTSRPSTSSLPPNTVLDRHSSDSTPSHSTPNSPGPHPSPDRRRLTPPPTPPLGRQSKPKIHPTGTPPPLKRHHIILPEFPLTKSKSHESQLANRVTEQKSSKSTTKKKPINLNLHGSHDTIYDGRRMSTDSGESGGTNRADTLMVQKSPKTARSMLHSINHRFSSKLIFGDCDYCSKHVFRGKVCKYCKKKFHRECATKAAPACGLPDEFLYKYLEFIRQDGGSPASPRHVMDLSGNNHNHESNNKMKPVQSVPTFVSVPDSSSNPSSCSSSTPSSPALITNPSSTSTSMTPPTPAGPNSPVIRVTEFQFPETNDNSSIVSSTTSGYLNTYNGFEPRVNDNHNADVINTNTSNDSDKTITSNSEKIIPDRTDSIDSQDDALLHRALSISVQIKEWDIPYEDLTRGDIIGHGRFGTVYKGHWHGEVAIKMLNMDPNADNQAQLSAFKMEVAMLRKTRHDNLVLFMGACMKPPHLAIVTSILKGYTLYTHIHMRKEKFTMNRIVIISSQIVQGMSYLHHRGIVHKDLKTKNIFLENGKVVITDFGLFNVTRLCQGNGKGDFLVIPPGWLCYLSPEIMRSLHAGERNEDLPFSEHSDVYAFGTVWYEMFCGEWPFKNQPPESIIWQVGRGMKQSLGNVNASKDVKDVLMQCWSYNPESRPEFVRFLKILERLPKKPLSRSPSHPIHLSRSAESVF
ncbi:kinase suppressor of Ras 2 [Lingula anatina]|uniref:Kinase suppressor of Ras 2 n=1 Tax=Lingula anatina TaxID=7574 RepID=A0A1S3J573_LINAN|nr:kinase suppressor of Ras 2 [Lingula anatina]|eukprot:XP_013405438.1 kinase suppressor of Ras 2 [Lingula anatina]